MDVFSVQDWLAREIGCSPAELELVSDLTEPDHVELFFALDGQPYGQVYEIAATSRSKRLIAAWGPGRSAHVRLPAATAVTWRAPHAGWQEQPREA